MSGILTCTRAMALATARKSGLSDGDMLRLEAHLSACRACAADARLLDDLAALATHARRQEPQASGAAGSSWRSALDRALTDERPRFAPARTRRTRPVAAIAIAALAALVLLGIAASRESPAPGATAAVGPGEATPSRASGHLHAVAPTRIRVAHAVLDAEGGTELLWSDALVTLEAGRVSVAVDPGPHRPFVVRTARFTVHVTGTRFEATLGSVRVTEGSVVVRSPEGTLLVELRAGEAWELLPTVPGPLAVAEVEPSAPAPPPGPRSPSPRRAAALRLERAEPAELAAEPAELAAEPAELAAEPPELAAEPPELAAEPAELVAAAETPAIVPASERFARAAALEPTDAALAARIYEELEREGGPWGQNALFARASLALSRGRGPEARALLERYVREHPAGANAEDARALLEALARP